MTYSSDLLQVPKEFLEYYRAGKEAARRGENARAHDLFRKAVEIDPYHEQVWLWLASVVETDEDRRVCFENVLELNPSNATARRQLMLLEQKSVVEVIQRDRSEKPRRGRKALVLLFSILFLIMVAVATSLVVGLI